jgi:hypothetical protein
MARDFSENYSLLFDFFGGASRDLYSAEQFLYLNRKSQFPIDYYVGSFRWIAGNRERYQALQPIDLADLAWLLLGTQDYTLKNWVETLENPNLYTNRITEFLRLRISEMQ